MKPTAKAIREAEPLSALAQHELRAMGAAGFVCCVCGEPGDLLSAWREHDDRDQPIEGPGAIIFLDKGHPFCIEAMQQHPRLYAEITGDPGLFPLLCGECPHRMLSSCEHPDLKANGGAGLQVTLSDPFQGAIICGRGGRIRPVRRALACVGFTPRATR